jgi:GNAT superfamily N-acetyltransferase
MKIQVAKSNTQEIGPLRVLFLQENNFQFIYNKCHAYGWADAYLFVLDGQPIGYGAIWGENNRADRDAIFEFYLIQPHRKFSNNCFKKLVELSGASSIVCQSNDPLLVSMLYQYASSIKADRILFKDTFQTHFNIPGLIFKKEDPQADEHPDARTYTLTINNELLATGGFLLNYNRPYADLYMEVMETHRRKGLGSFMIQELKRVCYETGNVPAARCNIDNIASQYTLQRAGMSICGFMLVGRL